MTVARPAATAALLSAALAAALLPALPAAAAPAAPAACATDAVPVGSVQGTGATSPEVGSVVTVRGTVVGDVPGFKGYFLQDRGDHDARTSDGVFVYAPTADVDLGDTVTATGRVAEYDGLTELTATATAVCRDGGVRDLPRPAALRLPADDATRERLEGMLVAPAQRLTVSEVYALTSFGELTLSSGGRLVQSTEVARPGAAADAVEADDVRRSIVLDDGLSSRTSITDRPYLTPTTPVRVGDRLRFTAPTVLSYGFDAWRLEPADGTAAGTFAPQDTRPARPAQVGGNLRIASFNVLNSFLTIGGAGRGATSEAERAQQGAKIVSAIGRLDADVVTLEEIEDTDSTGYSPGDADTAVADLVARLNAAEGAGTWDWARFPQELYGVPRDVIRNAIIYRPRSVTPVGKGVGLVDESVWSNAREPIAQTFRAGRETFTVIGNHLKSKSGTGTGDDADTGQGAFTATRVKQARSLAAFIARLQAETRDADVISLGDYNAYTREDPIEVLRGTGLTDLGSRFDRGRYSYVFDARSGSLDHALTTPSMTRKVVDATHWNINSVESGAYQYDGDEALYAPDPYRSSDHDPLVVGLRVRR